MDPTALLRAIEAGDAARVRRAIAEDAGAALRPIPFSDGSGNAVSPLHHACDAVFRGTLADARALDVARVLLDAGVDPDHRDRPGGDPYLVTAASLGAERVGLALLEAGADPAGVGARGETALHWAAYTGLVGLVEAIARTRGAPVAARDTAYRCTPLEWALHAWDEGSKGRREALPAVARALLAAGAEATDRARALAAAGGDGAGL